MGILNALGLMTRAEHDKLVLRIEGYRDKFRDQVRDTCARAEKAERNLRVADNQTKAAIASRDEWKAKFNAAAKDLAAQSDEIAALRPDAEWARARKAKAAEYEASKRVRKAAKKGAR